ncbi:BCCT family transporter [Tomitella biformata]|uniref:BCCT family transporter n=1 Tax=Tomitella biformata TaxID=630403 RepID=UPI000463D0B2|nr:BCCT family transporter [Tomitella biformata]
MNSIREAWRGIRKPVFIPASILILALIIFAVVYAESGADAFTALRDGIADGVGWWYILSATGFVFFAAYCAFSRVGNIRLGRDDEQPEFGIVSWFAMLFSAGMGIGLVFYGVGEPLSHFITPPEASGEESGSIDAAKSAMDLTMFHWGLHAWAIYVVVGLGLAYMTFRRGRPLSVRWLLEPMLGRKRIEGPIGHAIDVIAIVGTLFGVATSLGFGVQQISAGLSYLGWVETNNWLIILLIIGVTGLATFSVVSGVSKGLKWLSNINMVLAACLAAFVLMLGPTLFLLQSWVQNLGGYIQSLPGQMLATSPFLDDGWTSAWTIFYWGWWMSWAPFVGMFIARISRGRTIREFIAGVILAPTVVASIWFTIFGDSGILRQLDDGDMLVDGEVNIDTALFELLGGLPLGVVTSVLAIFVIVFFFVTSSDSGSLVIDILSTGGKLETPKITRVYWSVLEGIAAAVLLLVGGTGSLVALQTASIATAVPFSVVLVLACFSMLKAFRYDVAATPRYMRVSTPGSGSPGTVISTGGALPEPSGAGLSTTVKGFSATLSGLSPSSRALPDPAEPNQMVVAVHEVPISALDVDPVTGAMEYVSEQDLSDPLGTEVFDIEIPLIDDPVPSTD